MRQVCGGVHLSARADKPSSAEMQRAPSAASISGDILLSEISSDGAARRSWYMCASRLASARSSTRRSCSTPGLAARTPERAKLSTWASSANKRKGGGVVAVKAGLMSRRLFAAYGGR